MKKDIHVLVRTTWPHGVDLLLLSVCQTGVGERAAAMVVVEGAAAVEVVLVAVMMVKVR